MKQMYDFPYPILKPDLTSSYRPDCNFEILDIADANGITICYARKVFIE